MRARQNRTSLAAVVLTVGALAASGCGSDDGASSSTTAAATQPTSTRPVASIPDASPPAPGTPTTPTTDTDGRIPTSTTPPPPSNTTPTPQEQQGGGGEQAIRVPAIFVVRGGRLTPPAITVPARLAIELSITSDGQAHTLVLQTPEPHRLSVGANEQQSLRMPGLRAGSYTITLDGADAGELVVGGEAGP